MPGDEYVVTIGQSNGPDFKVKYWPETGQVDGGDTCISGCFDEIKALLDGYFLAD